MGSRAIISNNFNKNGVSIVITNTEEGYLLLEQIKNQFIYCIIEDFRDVFNRNGAYYYSVERHKFKHRLIKDLKRKPFDYIISKYDKINRFYKNMYRAINKIMSAFRKNKQQN